MNTHVEVLTPAGSGAIAVLSLRGPEAWSIAGEFFRTGSGARLPDNPPAVGFWFGRFGEARADEVVLARHEPNALEIHCHGGRQVVQWILGLLRSRGVEERAPAESRPGGFTDPVAAALLPFARTTRTASLLLDQSAGAYLRAVAAVAAGGPESAEIAAVLGRNAAVGRHLVEPWRVAIAGPPNAGKSSLLNALAGFNRSIVSAIPGTTRDAVSVSLALDGWPVDVLDTAGIRESADTIEREGIERARTAVGQSDLILWVVDATGDWPRSVELVAEELQATAERIILVLNKVDLTDRSAVELPEGLRISARTGEGVMELAASITRRLVPTPPAPGEPVPYTLADCERWSGLH